MRSLHHVSGLPLPLLPCTALWRRLLPRLVLLLQEGEGEERLLGCRWQPEVPFQDICSLMERVSKTSGTERKKNILATFIKQWREAHTRLHSTDADTTVSQLDSGL